MISVWGPSTAPFQPDPLTADALLTANDLEGPDLRYTFGTMHLGLDARVGGRIGFSVFAEYMPDYQNSRNIGDYGVVIVPIHSLGTEVTAWF